MKLTEPTFFERMDELVKWMRERGVSALSADGLVVQLEAQPPVIQQQQELVEEVIGPPDTMPPEGLCKVCGQAEPAGLLKAQGYCRGCARQKWTESLL